MDFLGMFALAIAATLMSDSALIEDRQIHFTTGAFFCGGSGKTLGYPSTIGP
jgi:hypothetical protein